MINSERIVSVTATDLLSLYKTILGAASVSVTKLVATAIGTFTATGTGDVGNLIAAEPVKTLDFASGVTAGVVYFTAAYDYKGFSVAGTAVETAGADVVADTATLYKATLSSGTVTIAAV
jgi:energy-converting hydrogenase Eha subunit C